MPKKRKPKHVAQYMHFGNWDGKSLQETRNKLGLTQKDIADVIGVTPVAICYIETGKSSNPWAIQMYGIVLERYWAGIHGYIPAYRKIGENHFMEEQNELYEIQRRDVQTQTGGRRSESCAS